MMMKIIAKAPREILHATLLVLAIRNASAIDVATIPSDGWVLEDWTIEPENIDQWMLRTTTTAADSITEKVVSSDVTDEQVSWIWDPVHWSWVLILQLLFALLGVIGNILVLVVLFQRRRHCRSTDTLIAALATADFLTSVFLIPIPKALQIPDDWTGLAYCKVLYPNFLLWVCISASIYTLMAIAIERFIAVVYPLYFSRSLTRRSVSVWVIIIWIASFLSAMRGLIILRVNSSTHKCALTYPSNLERIAYGSFVFAIRIVIPTLTMLITQTVIAVTLHRQASRFGNSGTDSKNPATFHVVAKNRVIKMMLIVIIIYVVCWSPNQIAFFGYNLGLVPTSYRYRNLISVFFLMLFFTPLCRYSNLNSVFTLMGFFNSCANPIIYTARHPEFRNAVKGLMFSGSVKPHSIFGHQETSVTALRKSDAHE